MVFIPDSVGYLLGTNCFGMTAYRYGRCKTAVLAMALVGISVILLPTASTMGQLVIPHLGMGLGIGIADAALVPLLASLVDQDGNYGPVYSIQQVAVSLAYSLGKFHFKACNSETVCSIKNSYHSFSVERKISDERY